MQLVRDCQYAWMILTHPQLLTIYNRLHLRPGTCLPSNLTTNDSATTGIDPVKVCDDDLVRLDDICATWLSGRFLVLIGGLKTAGDIADAMQMITHDTSELSQCGVRINMCDTDVDRTCTPGNPIDVLSSSERDFVYPQHIGGEGRGTSSSSSLMSRDVEGTLAKFVHHNSVRNVYTSMKKRVRMYIDSNIDKMCSSQSGVAVSVDDMDAAFSDAIVAHAMRELFTSSTRRDVKAAKAFHLVLPSPSRVEMTPCYTSPADNVKVWEDRDWHAGMMNAVAQARATVQFDGGRDDRNTCPQIHNFTRHSIVIDSFLGSTECDEQALGLGRESWLLVGAAKMMARPSTHLDQTNMRSLLENESWQVGVSMPCIPRSINSSLIVQLAGTAFFERSGNHYSTSTSGGVSVSNDIYIADFSKRSYQEAKADVKQRIAKLEAARDRYLRLARGFDSKTAKAYASIKSTTIEDTKLAAHLYFASIDL